MEFISGLVLIFYAYSPLCRETLIWNIPMGSLFSTDLRNTLKFGGAPLTR